MSYYSATYASPLGMIYIVSNESHLVGAWLEGQKYFCGSLKDRPEKNPELLVLKEAISWLDDYFEGKRPEISRLSLAPEGSSFRKVVWDILCEIPYGETMTYRAVAKEAASRMGKKSMSAQAVGGAIGHNPLSIIIPCHRVIGSDGSMKGYAGGIDKKIKLLQHEQSTLNVNPINNHGLQ